MDFLIGFFDNLDGEEKKIKDQYLELEKVLNCEDIEMNKTAIEIKINKKTDFSKIEPVIELLLDRGYKDCNFEDSFSVFSGFFEGKIDNLSDGEAYYLGIFSSILEQLEDPQFISNKENFLLLFDEPEMKMHPELARNFINQLIEFLGRTQNGKKFQILIATHSPFILSDMLPENILLLKKDESGCCHVEKCGISVFSANIHDILANGFFMNSTIGTYSKKILNEVIKSLYSDSDEEKIEKEKIDFIIKHIGEPILRDKLTSKYNEIYGDQKQDLGFDKYDLLKKIENLTEVSTENKKKIKKILHESFNGE